MNDDDQTTHQSADDALEPDSEQDGMFHPTKDEDKLDEDYGTPAAPADDVASKPLPADYPQGDVRPDEQEAYDEGEADAEIDNREEDNPSDRPRPLNPNE